MNKVLKAHTIIPSNLYVERDADKQIAEIISDMGRPGYILVARQMGKTNLLLNAKRNLEREGDVFAYIDLSNKFESARECFRNIIDVILDSNIDLLNEVNSSIQNKRSETVLTPHKEHGYELRSILNKIKGKLIINLDEIDSLTVADYSDKIFAQIRSVYFERINFNEYNRLSYILSGVAEPSDIIKDRSISPFNIGQKIFLGDFTYQEYEWFVEQSELLVTDDVKKRIYYWASGNPRLTWEICSEVEDTLFSVVDIDESTIDKIVKEKYLSQFDRPPIDHIRSLIQSRKDLRQGVIAIHYNKIDSISDDVKSKLYLAGILGSGYETGAVCIKNKIIEKSLEDKWLQEIEKIELESINVAENYFNNEKYREAAEIYNVLLSEDNNESEERNLHNRLGISYFRLGEYERSILHLEQSLLDKEAFKGPYTEQIYLLANSYHAIDKVKEAKKFYEEIISLGENSKYFYESYINLAGALIKEDHSKNKSKIVQLVNHVIQTCPKSNASYKLVLATAYYHLAKTDELDGDEGDAYFHYVKSSEFAEPDYVIRPLLSALQLREADGEVLFKRIVDILISANVDLVEKSGFSLELTHSVFVSLISISSERKYFETLDMMFDYAHDNLFKDSFGLSELILTSAMNMFTSGKHEASKYLLERLLATERTNVDPDNYFLTTKYLTYLSEDNGQANDAYFQGYQNYVESPDLIDVQLYEREIFKYFKKNEFDKSILLADRIIASGSDASVQSKARLLSIMYLRMLCIRDNQEKLQDALALKETMSTVVMNDLKFTNINEKLFNQIKNQIDEHIVALQSVSPNKVDVLKENKDKLGVSKFNSNEHIKALRALYEIPSKQEKHGRNEYITVRYTDGRTVRMKYKKIHTDIESGVCKVVK